MERGEITDNEKSDACYEEPCNEERDGGKPIPHKVTSLICT